MPKKKKVEVKKVSKPLEDVEFRGIPLEKLKDHTELHEPYESLYGYAALEKLL